MMPPMNIVYNTVHNSNQFSRFICYCIKASWVNIMFCKHSMLFTTLIEFSIYIGSMASPRYQKCASESTLSSVCLLSCFLYPLAAPGRVLISTLNASKLTIQTILYFPVSFQPRPGYNSLSACRRKSEEEAKANRYHNCPVKANPSSEVISSSSYFCLHQYQFPACDSRQSTVLLRPVILALCLQ